MRKAEKRTMQPLNRPQNKYWLAFGLCALGAAMVFLPFYIVDGGIFLYAGDFNSQQIPFYYYANEFVKSGGGSFSWATDLGSGFINSYSFYLVGSPFWWLSLLFPAAWLPFLMAPLLVLKFAVAGGGAYLWLRRYTKDPNMAVLGACLYAFSGFTVYNVFFNHFVDVVALFPYLLWALDEAVHEKRRGPFALLVALNLLNNYFFFAGQIVFLLIYFICMTASGSYRIKGRDFAALAFESAVGCGMGCVLAWPALLSLAQNPRTVDLSSGFGFLLYGKTQQYAAIVYSDGVCAGAELELLRAEFQLLRPVVLHAGAGNVRRHGARPGGRERGHPKGHPAHPGSAFCVLRLCPCACEGRGDGLGHRGDRIPGKVLAEFGPCAAGACDLLAFVAAVQAQAGAGKAADRRSAGVWLPVQHHPHRHRQVCPVGQRQKLARAAV